MVESCALGTAVGKVMCKVQITSRADPEALLLRGQAPSRLHSLLSSRGRSRGEKRITAANIYPLVLMHMVIYVITSYAAGCQFLYKGYPSVCQSTPSFVGCYALQLGSICYNTILTNFFYKFAEVEEESENWMSFWRDNETAEHLRVQYLFILYNTVWKCFDYHHRSLLLG